MPQDRDGVITFGTANNPHKYNREMFRVWAQVPSLFLLQLVDPEELGPTMVIYPEGVWYNVTTREEVDEILALPAPAEA